MQFSSFIEYVALDIPPTPRSYRDCIFLGAYGLARMSTYADFDGDMNNLKLNAWGYVRTTTTNAPSGITAFSFLSFCAWSGAPIQIVVGTGGFAIRRILFDNWSPWYKISS